MRADDEDLAKKYKVTSYPAFFLLKGGEKPLKYEGETYLYKDLFEFINIYSETFVFVGDNAANQEVKSAASRPWLSTVVPYMAKDSANDLCLKKDGTLCVIYVVKDAASSDNQVISAMRDVKDLFVSKIERGITFNFMRVDASLEPEFAAMFGEPSDFPAVVVMNPGKRKRFLKHEGELTSESIQNTLDTILGGDARFKAIKNMAELASDYEAYVQ